MRSTQSQALTAGKQRRIKPHESGPPTAACKAAGDITAASRLLKKHERPTESGKAEAPEPSAALEMEGRLVPSEETGVGSSRGRDGPSARHGLTTTPASRTSTTRRRSI